LIISFVYELYLDCSQDEPLSYTFRSKIISFDSCCANTPQTNTKHTHGRPTAVSGLPNSC